LVTLVLYINFENWDLRKAVVSGRSKKFVRYIDKLLDESFQLVREVGEKYKNVSQGILIINLNDFNLVQHGCVQCEQIIKYLVHEIKHLARIITTSHEFYSTLNRYIDYSEDYCRVRKPLSRIGGQDYRHKQ
jgi:hypothetical protein